MAARVNTIHLSPVLASDQVTSRPVTVEFADGTPTLNIDMIDPTTTFSASDGDVLTVTPLGDINLIGQGPTAGPFPYTVTPTPPPPPPPPTTVPGPVSVIGVSSV